MRRRMALAAGALALAPLLAFPLAASADAQGSAYGHGCTLSDGSSYATPGQMLVALAARDGSFQTTVEKYHFGTVANLIASKCGE